MFVVGLTGGIASGKSTVSKTLRQLGAAICDADKIAKELQEAGTEVWQEITHTFGPDILLNDGSLNRQALGEIVFNDNDARQKLDSIVHPKVMERVNMVIAESNARVVIVDAPLLIEAHMTAMVDEVWVVSVSEQLQLKRLMQRNNLDEREALARLRSQMPLSDKLKYADKVIDNSGSIEQTRQIVGHLWQDLMHRIALKERPGG